MRRATALEPTPPSRDALDRLTAYGDPELTDLIMGMGEAVTRLVPDCVGLSVTFLAEDFTFTLVSSSSSARLLDAMQYLDDGPCLDAVRTGDILALSTADLLDEGRWQLFAQAEAAVGVASSLSLPVLLEDQAIGSVNVYASTDDAFDGHVEEIAAACEAWAPGAVMNADLGFTSRLRAAVTAHRMEERALVDRAIGAVAAAQRLDMQEAAARIRQAALRAGVSEPEFARIIVDSATVR